MRAAARLRLEVRFHDVRDRSEYAAALARLRQEGAEALVIGPGTEFFQDAAELARLARAAGLPTSCEWAEMARSGCLIGYGPDIVDLRRRAASYIARVLRGMPPAEIPIEEPQRFALGVNLGTARALGIALPDGVTAQADEVFE